MKISDISGMSFGYLTVIKLDHTKNSRAYWLCKCECGVEKAILGKHLRGGQVTSCGCKRGAKKIYEDYSVRRKELAQLNPEKQREYQRRYRESHIEERQQDSRDRSALYRKQNANLTILEAVKDSGRFWAMVAVAGSDECWNWKGPKTERLYGVYAPLPGVLLRAHRVAYALHNNGIDDTLFVCHKCDNPSCCNPKHLFLGTPLDNISDMISKGRDVRLSGEKNPNSKLTTEQVRAIFCDLRTSKEIAAQYNVSKSLVSLIRVRKVRTAETADLPDQTRRKTGPHRLSNTELQGITA